MFHNTLNDSYNIGSYTKLLMKHKNRYNEMVEKQGFMVAFWYNIAVFKNTFLQRIIKKGIFGIPDISEERKEIEEDCYSTSS